MSRAGRAWRDGSRCDHRASLTTITAGLARRVCEVCGHVSVQYVENAVQTYPNVEFAESAGWEALTACDFCSNMAMYQIPNATACDAHAWELASSVDWFHETMWVPIRLSLFRS